ncbi:glycosyltransferase [Ruegeria atlantica]|uniref:glycosyltransferase n=1 Tax=Ruegeria atlantica TaxID=81569 RepID=UPI0014810F00|nr:glycosyltransferase [Ruegeria atlantica]
MKILHVTNAWPNENNPIKGIFIREQIEALRGFGADIDVEVIDGSSGKSAYLKAVSKLRSLKGQYDIIHTHHVLTGLIAVAAGIGRDKHVTSFLNGRGTNILRIPTGLSKTLERLLSRCTAVNIFKNDSFTDIRRPQDVTIANAVDPEQFQIVEAGQARHVLRLEGSAFRPLFVSANNLHRPAKRLDRFEEIVSKLPEHGIQCEPLYLSNEPRDRVPYFFNAADALVITSEHEGSPNAVKEALAVGLPVVSTRVGDVPMQTQGVSDSIVLDPFDVDAFCAHIADIVRNPKADRAQRRAQYLAHANGPMDAAERILKIYRNVSESV